MKHNGILSILICITFLLNGCKNDDPRNFPSVTTLSTIEVTNEGAVIHSAISKDNIFEIIDHGILYCLAGMSNQEELYNEVSLGILNGESSFSVKLDHNLIPDRVYVVKAYIKTKNQIIYGNQLTFTSQGSKSPFIKNISPVKAYAGDTLIIHGKYFGENNTENKVYFESLETYPFLSTDSVLKVIVPIPNEKEVVNLTVEVAAKRSPNVPFTFGEPYVYSLTPEKALLNKTIEIRGRGFSLVEYIMTDDNRTQINWTKSDTLISFQSNFSFVNTGEIYLVERERTTKIDKHFELLYPEIQSVTPTMVWIDSIISIRGKYLDQFYDFSIELQQQELVSTSDSLVKYKITKPFHPGSILAQSHDIGEIYSAEVLTFNPPFITSSFPAEANYGDTIFLKGERFFPELQSFEYSYGDFKYVSKNEAFYIIPWIFPARNNIVALAYDYEIYTTTFNFTNPKITIESVTPTEIQIGTEITIKMQRLPESTKTQNVYCFIDGNSLQVLSVANGVIKAKVVETNLCKDYPRLIVSIARQSDEVANLLHLNR